MPKLVANNLSVAEFEALKQGQGDVEGGNLSLAGPGLEWEDVSFHVGETPILDKVSGSVAGGSVCAILGPSGAGKSSLLNVLAGRNSTRGKIKVTAYVEVGGQPVDPVSFRRNVAYVMQDDALIPTATPREALAFSASLRLGDSVSEAEKSRRVEKMLDELGLTGCADVLIGGEMIKGISGGQRKRTSVGIELVTRPKIVFLDEPTSGLDSDSALSCIKLLKSVASKGATVLCTIHQPSSEVFDLFDMVMLLKDGKIMYQGPTGGVVDFFTERGYAPPAHHNPADFMMTVATREPMDDLTRAGFFARPSKIVRSASGNSLKEVTAGDGSSGAGAHAGQSVSGETIQPVEASFGKQLYKLLERELVANKRDTAALVGRFGITIFLNTLFGLIFANAGARDAAKGDGLSSHFGAIVMVTIGSMFGTAQPVMLGFPLERPIFLREVHKARTDRHAKKRTRRKEGRKEGRPSKREQVNELEQEQQLRALVFSPVRLFAPVGVASLALPRRRSDHLPSPDGKKRRVLV